MVPEDLQNIIHNVAKLKWACRRGMLELDVLLGNFLDQRYEGLSTQEKEVFVRLLSAADPELFDWLMGQSQPDDKDLAHMIKMIRNHANPNF